MSNDGQGTEKPAGLISKLLTVDMLVERKMGLLPVGPEDHVVGVMSENLQRLNALAFDLCNEQKGVAQIANEIARKHNLDHANGTEGDTCSAIREQLEGLQETRRRLETERKLTRDLFIATLMFEHPSLVCKSGADFRQGNQIVYRAEVDEEEGLGSLLDGLFSSEDIESLRLGGGIHIVRM